MTILPEPARFTKQEYRKFLADYPHVEAILASPFVSDEGEEIPLVKETRDEVLVYVGLISEEQKKALGNAALREMHTHFHKSGKTWIVLFVMGLAGLAIIGVIMWKLGILDSDKENGKITPTPTTITPTETPTVTPKPTPMPTLIPTFTPVTTPTSKPTLTPTPTIIPTITPTPTPMSTVTSLATPPPTPTAYIRQVVIKDVGGKMIPYGKGTFFIKPREEVTITVDIEGSSHDSLKVDYQTARGKIEASGKYVAPDMPGNTDVVTIKVSDITTGNIIIQKRVKIQIIDTSE